MEWSNIFLKFIGINEEVKETLNKEFVTLYGRRAYVDYLCRLKNNDLLHVEFQYKSANEKDLKRFHFYNSLIRSNYEGDLETFVFNFESKKDLKVEIEKSITFHPPNFNLEDVEFKDYCEKINRDCRKLIFFTRNDSFPKIFKPSKNKLANHQPLIFDLNEIEKHKYDKKQNINVK